MRTPEEKKWIEFVVELCSQGCTDNYGKPGEIQLHSGWIRVYAAALTELEALGLAKPAYPDQDGTSRDYAVILYPDWRERLAQL